MRFPYGFELLAQTRWEERVTFLQGRGLENSVARALANLEPSLPFDVWLERVRLLLGSI